MLRILQSNRLEALAEELIASLREQPAPLPQREVVVVPHLGMARWLECRIADALGICAQIEFTYAAQFIWRSIARVLPAVPASSPFDAGVLGLRLFELLRALPEHRDYAPLRRYLADEDPRRRLALAERIARCYDQVLIYRPDWLEAWNHNRELALHPAEAERWQRRLWRELAGALDPAVQRHPKEAFFEQLAQDPALAQRLPVRVRVFGLPLLPPLYVEVLVRLSALREIEWYILNPCREYWADIVSERRQARLALQGGSPAQAREVGHALLASWGTQAQDNLSLVAGQLGELGVQDQECYVEPPETHLLGRLQASLLNLTDPAPQALDAADDSIQVHACHSLTRQLEVLHDRLLGLFESRPGLRAHEVAVLVPDLDGAAPLIEAVFGAVPAARHIPWQITGRGRSEATPLLRAFVQMLDLPGSRFAAAAVLDFLAQPVVARRYELDSAELERLQAWLSHTGARWGLDGAHRAELGLPDEVRHSWLDSLQRLLLGYALPAGEARLFQGLLPFDDLEGSQALVLGKLLRALADLVELRRRFAESRSLVQWCEQFASAIERCLAPALDDAADEQRLRAALARLREDAERAGSRERVPLDVARSLVETRLLDAAPGGVPGGGVSFAGIGPLRGLPFRVLCVLGLDDGAFPRNPVAPEFDLVAAQPRLGDRARREDDRGAFLDAILAAREVLILGYTGRSIRDNAELPPSVLVSELLEYLSRHVEGGRMALHAALVRSHPLQVFSAANYTGAHASYAAEWLSAATALQQPVETRRPLPPLVSAPLPQGDDEDRRDCDLETLVRFLRHPVRALLRDGLGLELREAEARIADEEPFTLDPELGWALDDRLLQASLDGRDEAQTVSLLLAGLDLPHGDWGRRIVQQRLAPVRDFATRVRASFDLPLLESLGFELELGACRLGGVLNKLTAAGQRVSSYRKLGVHTLLDLWPRHLVLNVLRPPGIECRSELLTVEGLHVLRPLADADTARVLLADLLDLRAEGLRSPLPFMPRSAWALLREKDGEKAARNAWLGGFRPGECEDPWYTLLYRQAPSDLPPGFADCARRVLAPLLAQLAEPAT